jgi:hypothetical protein
MKKIAGIKSIRSRPLLHDETKGYLLFLCQEPFADCATAQTANSP